MSNDIQSAGGSRKATSVSPQTTAEATPGNRATDTSLGLPSPEARSLVSDGDISALAALIAKSCREDHRRAREGSLSAERSLREEGLKRVDAMLEQADAIQSAAAAKGWGEIAGGALKIAGGALQMEGGLDKLDNGGKVTERCVVLTRAGSMAAAGGNAASGIGTVLGGGHDADKARFEAQGERHRLAQDLAKSAYDRLEDEAKEARDMERKIKEYLAGILGAKNDSLKAASQRA